MQRRATYRTTWLCPPRSCILAFLQKQSWNIRLLFSIVCTYPHVKITLCFMLFCKNSRLNFGPNLRTNRISYMVKKKLILAPSTNIEIPERKIINLCRKKCWGWLGLFSRSFKTKFTIMFSQKKISFIICKQLIFLTCFP